MSDFTQILTGNNGMATNYPDRWGHGGATNDLKLLASQIEQIQKYLRDNKNLTADDLRQASEKLDELSNKMSEVSDGNSKFTSSLDAASAFMKGDLMGGFNSMKEAGVNISANFLTSMNYVTAGMQAVSNIIGGVADTILAATSQFDSAIQTGVENFAKYTGKVNARLYGLEEGLTDYYGTFAKEVSTALADNSYIYQVDVLDNIAALVEKGVGYNLESRAYLATLTDKTVTTFNALDETLLRSIRMYGMDITAPMMGAESLVTQLLNSLFKDSSYLSGMYDTVYSAIYEANSQLTSSESVTWSLAVQSWLGSLYSAGVSDNTISALAQGLNYLGTGDVTALSGNQALQTIFAMAAANAGLSYGNILLNGLDVETTDKLLQAIVDQLQDISANTSTEVVKKAWTEVLGISISDLSAIEKLDSAKISAISALVTGTTYTNTLEELERQVEEYLVDESRTTISERIQNTMDNMMYSVGSAIASDSSLYQTWAQAKFMVGLSESLPFDLFGLGENILKLVNAAKIEGVIEDAIGFVNATLTGIPLSYEDLEANKEQYPELYEAWMQYKNGLNFGTLVSINQGISGEYRQFLANQGFSDEAALSGQNIWSFLGEYYNQLFTDMGSDNRSGLWAFFSDAYNTGGTGATRGAEVGASVLAQATEEIKNLSYSMETVAASTSGVSLTKLANAEASGETVTVQGAEATATYDINSLYELLTDETKSIRVKLVDVDDETVFKLGLDELRSYLVGINNGGFASTIQASRMF